MIKPVRTESGFLDRLAEAKIRAIAWYMDWEVVEKDQLTYAPDEEVPITIVDVPPAWPASYCPVNEKLSSGEKRIIRYQRMKIRWWWTPWVMFRLGLRIGDHVHPNIHVHIVPRKDRRSIYLGWVESEHHE